MSLGALAMAMMIMYPAAGFGQDGTWQQERRLAIDLLQHGQLTEAFAAAARLLARAERNEPGSEPLPLALHDYGIIAADLNRFDEADRALRRAIRLVEATPSNDPDAVRILYLRLGEMCLDSGRFRDAKATLLELQRTLEETAPASGYLGIALDHLAWLAIVEKRLDDAEPLLQRSLRILDGNPQLPPARIAEVLNDYATLMLARKRFSESALYAERAQSLSNAAGEPIDGAVINTWTLLGAAYAFSGRSSEALPYILRSVEAAKSTFGEGSVRTGRLMIVAAAVLRQCGQKAQAKALQKQGGKIVAKADHENPGRFTVDISALR